MTESSSVGTPRVRWYSGLRARFFFFGVAVALPLIALASYRQVERWRHESAEIEQSLLDATLLVAERIELRIQLATGVLDAMGTAVRFDPASRSRNDSLLARWRNTSGQAYSNIFATMLDGSLVGAAKYNAVFDSLRPARQMMLDRLETTPRLMFGLRGRSRIRSDSAYVILLARGVYEEGKMIGMISLTIKVDSLAELVGVPSIAKGTEVVLFDTTGAVIAVSNDGVVTVPDSLRAIKPVGLSAAPAVARVRLDSSGGYYLVGHAATGRAPWYVNVSVPEESISAPRRAAAARAISLVIVVIILAPIVAWFVGGRLVRPINTLVNDANAISRGLVRHRSRVSDSSEIGALARAFNDMAETVERRNAAIADSERRYRLLFESNPLPMYAWDAENLRILAVNEAALTHYGYDRRTFLSLRITDLIDQVDHARFHANRLPFSEDRQYAGSWTHCTADGRCVEMDIVTTSTRRLGRAGWLSVAIDVTAKVAAERALARSEEQLRQAQKMEAIGTFAGGIAHDFNNLLTGMLGYTDLALADLDGNEEAQANMMEVRKLAVRGADLTRQILAASRKQVAEPEVVEVNEVVRGMEALLKRIIGEHIQVRTTLENDTARIEADPGQLEQIFLNLAANARDAMPEGGALCILTYTAGAGEILEARLDPGKAWVAISFRDTGIGMTEEVRKRIFEPFFTTKGSANGTGLGLALVHGMIEHAGGAIRVKSEVGVGSTFTIYFPAVTRAANPRASIEHSRRDLHGDETILIVEDDESVRKIAVAALKRCGYSVLAAEDSDHAVRLARSYDGPIHLLLTDVVMPGQNGRELASDIRGFRPDVKIVFASGYTDDEELLRGIRREDIPFLQKPFTASELTQLVRDVLDGSTVG